MGKAPEVYIDKPAALRRLGGNESLFNRMLGLFLQSQEPQKLEKALAQKNYEEGAAAAHALKGMAGNLSLNALYTQSDALMQQLRKGPPAPQTVQYYRQVLQTTRHEIETAIGRGV